MQHSTDHRGWMHRSPWEKDREHIIRVVGLGTGKIGSSRKGQPGWHLGAMWKPSPVKMSWNLWGLLLWGQRLLVMFDTEPESTTSCNLTRLLMVGLGKQFNYNAINIQSIWPARCSGSVVAQSLWEWPMSRKEVPDWHCLDALQSDFGWPGDLG